MAFNGSGVFNRLYNWVNDRNASIKIRADRMDAEMDGFATGLSNCITRDGQSTISADTPWNNKKITGLADAAAATDALTWAVGDTRYRHVILDTTLVSTNSAIVVPLQSFKNAHVNLTVFPNSAVADFNIYWQTSTDGVNFDSGSNNYLHVVSKTNGTARAESTGSATAGNMFASTVDTASSVAYATVVADYFNGDSSHFPRLAGKSVLFNSTYEVSEFMSQRQASITPTHIRFIADVANGFGIGTRLIVDAR